MPQSDTPSLSNTGVHTTIEGETATLPAELQRLSSIVSACQTGIKTAVERLIPKEADCTGGVDNTVSRDELIVNARKSLAKESEMRGKGSYSNQRYRGLSNLSDVLKDTSTAGGAVTSLSTRPPSAEICDDSGLCLVDDDGTSLEFGVATGEALINSLEGCSIAEPLAPSPLINTKPPDPTVAKVDYSSRAERTVNAHMPNELTAEKSSRRRTPSLVRVLKKTGTRWWERIRQNGYIQDIERSWFDEFNAEFSPRENDDNKWKREKRCRQGLPPLPCPPMSYSAIPPSVAEGGRMPHQESKSISEKAATATSTPHHGWSWRWGNPLVLESMQARQLSTTKTEFVSNSALPPESVSASGNQCSRRSETPESVETVPRFRARVNPLGSRSTTEVIHPEPVSPEHLPTACSTATATEPATTYLPAPVTDITYSGEEADDIGPSEFSPWPGVKPTPPPGGEGVTKHQQEQALGMSGTAPIIDSAETSPLTVGAGVTGNSRSFNRSRSVCPDIAASDHIAGSKSVTDPGGEQSAANRDGQIHQPGPADLAMQHEKGSGDPDGLIDAEDIFQDGSRQQSLAWSLSQAATASIGSATDLMSDMWDPALEILATRHLVDGNMDPATSTVARALPPGLGIRRAGSGQQSPPPPKVSDAALTQTLRSARVPATALASPPRCGFPGARPATAEGGPRREQPRVFAGATTAANGKIDGSYCKTRKQVEHKVHAHLRHNRPENMVTLKSTARGIEIRDRRLYTRLQNRAEDVLLVEPAVVAAVGINKESVCKAIAGEVNCTCHVVGTGGISEQNNNLATKILSALELRDATPCTADFFAAHLVDATFNRLISPADQRSMLYSGSLSPLQMWGIWPSLTFIAAAANEKESNCRALFVNTTLVLIAGRDLTAHELLMVDLRVSDNESADARPRPQSAAAVVGPNALRVNQPSTDGNKTPVFFGPQLGPAVSLLGSQCWRPQPQMLTTPMASAPAVRSEQSIHQEFIHIKNLITAPATSKQVNKTRMDDIRGYIWATASSPSRKAFGKEVAQLAWETFKGDAHTEHIWGECLSLFHQKEAYAPQEQYPAAPAVVTSVTGTY